MESVEFGGKCYTLTAFHKASGILAEDIPSAEWTDSLFQAIGRAVGRFHRVSAAYERVEGTPNRLDWCDSNEIHTAMRNFDEGSDPAREKLSRLVAELKQLPATPADYGLIHNDLHFANFLVGTDGKVTIIDFDDCAYGWFAMDIAMGLFDVLVLYKPANDEDARQFTRKFLSSYLAGYREEHPFPSYWQRQLPLFLKLKELCIYASLLGHVDSNKPGCWVGDFMGGRAQRIAADLPYVDIDPLVSI